MVGHYNMDRLMYGLFIMAAAKGEIWKNGWMSGFSAVKIDRHTSTVTWRNLEAAGSYNSKAKPLYSAPANYGSAYHSPWDENNKDRAMGMTLEEIETLMETKGLLYE